MEREEKKILDLEKKFQVLEGILFAQTVQLVQRYKYHEENTIQTIQIQREGEVFCLSQMNSTECKSVCLVDMPQESKMSLFTLT